MRSFSVALSRPQVVRVVVSSLLAALVAAAAVVPDAEAARRKRAPRQGGYAPPQASIVVDVNSGKVLQESQADAHRHPASVTKVMTLYLLFEQLERGRFRLDSELPVSREAASQAPSKLGLRPGESIEVEDAIKALVTKSANDIAVVVAEAIGGDEEGFARLMTQKARALGMKRTLFRNASGLPDPEQVTTARDLATLGKAIHDRFPKYYTYFQTRAFHYDGASYRNHNRLLGKVEGVDGIKTGFTRASGFNLLTSAKSNGRHIITVVLGGRSAGSRDAQVAGLVQSHLPRAYAGRRLTGRTVEVAEADTSAAPPARVAGLPQPPNRPRPAVIAETRTTAPDVDSELTRTRPMALAASGSTGIVRSATTPLALVGTTPRSGTMPAPQAPAESRLLPPGNVRFTNTTTAAAKPELEQPIPTAPVASRPLPAPNEGSKVEERLASATARTAMPAPQAPAPVAAPVVAAPAPAPSVAPTKLAMKAPAIESKPAPRAAPAATARSGWIVQLAAADSESKARSILDSAKEKTGRALKDAEPFTEAVTKGGSTLYRARFAGFDEAEEAQAACKTLKRSGFNCIAQKI